MTDPFQDVDAASPDFIAVVVGALEARASEVQMIPIIEHYLDSLDWGDRSVHVEVGAGTGPIARRMAARASSGEVIAIDTSAELLKSGKRLAEGIGNIAFEVGSGEALRFESGTVDSVVMHTVLSHVPTPAALLDEANRVLKPGGKIVVCDADFEKTCLGNFEGDPLNSSARYFVANFVSQPYLISNIRQLVTAAGFAIDEFRIDSRALIDTDGGLGWIRMGSGMMVQQGLIARELADALEGEYLRRKALGVLYGHQPFGTVMATKGR